jgi:hypothetical protein
LLLLKMGFRIRQAIQQVASTILYSIVLWFIALIIDCAYGEDVSSPAIVFGIVHAAEALALMFVIAGMIRFPYAYLPAIVINLLFLISMIVMFVLFITGSVGSTQHYKMFTTSPHMHLILGWEFLMAFLLTILVAWEMMEHTPIKELFKKMCKKKEKQEDKVLDDKNDSPKPNDKNKSQETIKTAPTQTVPVIVKPLKVVPVAAVEPAKTAKKQDDDADTQDGIMELHSETDHHDDPNPNAEPAMNELKIGADFEKELARALLM